MFDSNRVIIIAAFGWLVLAAAPAPNERADYETAKPETNVERSLNQIATAQINAVEQSKAGEYEAPCGKGEYNSKSDLCAQWYAAISAGESARYSFWAVWLGIASTILSLFGLGAIIVTIRQGRTANQVAIAALEHGARPLLVFETFTCSTKQKGLPLAIAHLGVRNLGKGPARIIEATLQIAKTPRFPKRRNDMGSAPVPIIFSDPSPLVVSNTSAPGTVIVGPLRQFDDFRMSAVAIVKYTHAIGEGAKTYYTSVALELHPVLEQDGKLVVTFSSPERVLNAVAAEIRVDGASWVMK